MNIVDTLPFDWTRPESRQLLKILLDGFPSLEDALELITRVGLRPSDVALSGLLRHTWRSIIDEARRQDLLRPLLQEVLLEPRVAAIHDSLREILGPTKPKSTGVSMSERPSVEGASQRVLLPEGSPGAVSVSIFICVAPEDRGYVISLRHHLALAERRRQVRLWDKGELLAGSSVEEVTMQELRKAKVILLLVSAHLFASSDCEPLLREAELRMQAGTARVVPILLNWTAELNQSSFIGSALPRGGRPILSWQNCDEAWSQVVSELQQLFKELH